MITNPRATTTSFLPFLDHFYYKSSIWSEHGENPEHGNQKTKHPAPLPLSPHPRRVHTETGTLSTVGDGPPKSEIQSTCAGKKPTVFGITNTNVLEGFHKALQNRFMPYMDDECSQARLRNSHVWPQQCHARQLQSKSH